MDFTAVHPDHVVGIIERSPAASVMLVASSKQAEAAKRCST